MKQAILPLVAGVFLIALSASIQAYTYNYDDFSGFSLNTSRWDEIEDGVFPDEHLVNSTEQAYHITQLSVEGDRGVYLVPKVGIWSETIEYDLNYVSGSGNHLHNIWLHPYGIFPDYCSGNCYIGYWNAPGLYGSQTGTYHIRMDFNHTSEEVFLSIKRPDGSYFNGTGDLSITSPPYYLLIQTGTGHNGIMHFDIDNVTLISHGLPEPPEPPEECSCSELESRISELEERLDELEENDCSERLDDVEERVGILEAALEGIQNAVIVLNGGVDDIRGIILGYLNKLPHGLSKRF